MKNNSNTLGLHNMNGLSADDKRTCALNDMNCRAGQPEQTASLQDMNAVNEQRGLYICPLFTESYAKRRLFHEQEAEKRAVQSEKHERPVPRRCAHLCAGRYELPERAGGTPFLPTGHERRPKQASQKVSPDRYERRGRAVGFQCASCRGRCGHRPLQSLGESVQLANSDRKADLPQLFKRNCLQI